MPYFIPQLALLGVLLVLSAFFSGSEAAVFSLTKLEKKRLNTRHPKTWKIISSLLDHPRRTLITILIGNMLVNTMAAALATHLIVELVGPNGVAWAIPIFTIILVVTGELVPKVFAVNYNEYFAFLFAIPLDLMARVF